MIQEHAYLLKLSPPFFPFVELIILLLLDKFPWYMELWIVDANSLLDDIRILNVTIKKLHDITVRQCPRPIL